MFCLKTEEWGVLLILLSIFLFCCYKTPTNYRKNILPFVVWSVSLHQMRGSELWGGRRVAEEKHNSPCRRQRGQALTLALPSSFSWWFAAWSQSIPTCLSATSLVYGPWCEGSRGTLNLYSIHANWLITLVTDRPDFEHWSKQSTNENASTRC